MVEPDSPLKLHVLDVGHGDCLILEFPDGISHAIIDCNRRKESNRGFGQDYDPSEPKVLTYFRSLVQDGISPIVEFVCLTHPHLDHYRGFGDLLRGLINLGIPIRQFWDFGVSGKKARAIMQLAKTSEFEEQKDEIVKLLQVKYELIRRGMEQRILINPTKGFWKKHGVEIDVVAPHANQFEVYSNYLGCKTARERQEYRLFFRRRRCLTDEKRACICPADDNIISSGLLVKYGNCRLLLAGDIPNCSWRGVLGRSDQINPSCHCIKVSHHGSVEGNFPYSQKSLWDAIKLPDGKLVAMISGGYRVNLPHEDTINSLKKAGCDTYCTGPRTSIALRPYVPPGEFEPIVQILLEEICFVEDYGQHAKDVQEVDGGHGNITVECFVNGDCKVLTETMYSA